MRKLSLLLIIFTMIFSLSAMNKPKAMCVYIEMPDGSAPSAASIGFSAHIDGRSSEVLTDTSPGCGYIENASDGICYLNLGSFETAWSSEEHLMWSIEMNDLPYAVLNQKILNDEGVSQYSYESDPYDLSSTPLPVTLSSFMAIFSDGLPILNWVTQAEVNNSGWNIYRSEVEEFETSLQVNTELIAGMGSSTEISEYSFRDEYDVTTGTVYWYLLESVDFGGNSETYGPISLEIPEGGENPEPDIPPVYGVHCNYPNPFNPDTAIEFVPEKAGYIEINILNIKGQLVKTIYSDNIEEKEVGSIRTAVWDGTNQRGKSAGSGIYFCSYKSTARNQITKMVLIK